MTLQGFLDQFQKLWSTLDFFRCVLLIKSGIFWKVMEQIQKLWSTLDFFRIVFLTKLNLFRSFSYLSFSFSYPNLFLKTLCCCWQLVMNKFYTYNRCERYRRRWLSDKRHNKSDVQRNIGFRQDPL